MSIAILGVKLNSEPDKVINIETGALRYVDSITKSYKNVDELLSDETYALKVKPYRMNHTIDDNSDLVLTYIRNNEEKVELDVLFDDEDEIRTRTSSLEDIKSETEKARKLLLNSKHQMFLTSFLLNKNLKDTTSPTVKMTLNEYRIAKKEGYPVSTYDGEYHISIGDVLKYRLDHKKLGPMRLLVEDTLEVWKRKMLGLSNEDLYFYSRELRMLINEYNYRKMPHKVVSKLSFNKEHLSEDLSLKHYNTFRCSSTVGLSKKKVLDEKKVA